MSEIKIAIADDHMIIQDGLKLLLKNTRLNIEVVFTANDGEELLSKLSKNKDTKIVILDIKMPKMDGLTALRSIRENDKNIKIIMLTMHHKKAYIDESIKLGANAFLTKNVGREELLDTIDYCYNNDGFYYSNLITDNNINESDSQFLSNREIEIVKLLAEGYSSQEISERLFLSELTIHNYRKNLLTKTGTKNTSGLILYAIEKKIIYLDGYNKQEISY